MLQPLFGIAVLIGLAYALSTKRQAVRWRPVMVGLAMQWVLAFLVLKTDFGAVFFHGAQRFFRGLIDMSKEAGRTVLGDSALGLTEEPAVFGAIVLVTVIFFSSMFSVLHHVGIVRVIVGGMARMR